MSVPCTKARWLLGLFAATAAAGIGFALWRHQRPSADGAAEHATFPIPGFSASKYLNTGPEARPIGGTMCAECHPKKHQSYLLTPHSRALSDIDPKLEPLDGEFFHKASGRSYRVYRRDGQFRHAEILRTPQGEEIARVDVPIRYLIGSGNFTRSYLVEIDGFLHESPITWYTSKKRWDMSPGYDNPHHWGFERAAKVGCLACHAGRVEPADYSVHRMTIHEKAIGCESCHGPGSLHEALHRSRKHVAGTEDLTIVNPSNLSRSLLESVCAVCHLSGPASILLRGRKATDYRPGMPLTDYRIDYRFDSGNEQMTVVGHIEQLRQSACYKKSEAMTCLTCHDPHAKEKPADSVAFYRQKCLDCHAEKGCKLKKAERLKKEPADNCATCHMPHGDTEIPHISFTHHRIGLHTAQRTESAKIPALIPTDDGSGLPELEQKRSLGLAYYEATRNSHYARYIPVFGERARELLEEVRAAGLREADTAQALAGIYFYWKKDPVRASVYAREAVNAKGASPEVRAMALTLLAACEMDDRNFQEAIEPVEELMRLQRSAHDRRLLGVCYLELEQPSKALPPLREALAIRPYRPVIHEDLARVYDQLGDRKRAAEHREKARWLRDNNQD
jgi:tetratricopeptide (TPR) repeat protein